ncbi:MAG: NADH-quinone oxidoreductase subunit J [Candidatus Sumerlaeia bacterium]|nr:NADH-quinone oxidoreductase subunit J [Candidatus Sumerlaeia bacterium]
MKLISLQYAFYAFLATMAILSAAYVAFSRKTVYAVLALVVTMLSLAGIFLLIQSPFAALIQVFVYAGAILVLFLYVIMLLNPRQTDVTIRSMVEHRGPMLVVAGVLTASFFFLTAKWLITVYGADEFQFKEFSLIEVASRLLSDYLLPFELTSILLLMAIIGAVLIAKRN